MKLGSFVGQINLQPTDEEIAYIERQISNMMNGTFSYRPFKIEKTILDATHTVVFKVVDYFDGKTQYRDASSNTYIPKHITVTFNKQKGYDEKVVGRFYEWKDGFVPEYNITSYDCRISLIGIYRPYGAKKAYMNQIIHKFTYGTELADLEVASGMRDISNYYYHSNLNKGVSIL